jgi:hypothetical protein
MPNTMTFYYVIFKFLCTWNFHKFSFILFASFYYYIYWQPRFPLNKFWILFSLCLRRHHMHFYLVFFIFKGLIHIQFSQEITTQWVEKKIKQFYGLLKYCKHLWNINKSRYFHFFPFTIVKIYKINSFVCFNVCVWKGCLVIAHKKIKCNQFFSTKNVRKNGINT